jgi:hypothetical protein
MVILSSDMLRVTVRVRLGRGRSHVCRFKKETMDKHAYKRSPNMQFMPFPDRMAKQGQGKARQGKARQLTRDASQLPTDD